MKLRDYRPAGGWAMLAAVLVGLTALGLAIVVVAHDQVTRTSVILPAAQTSPPAQGSHGGPGTKGPSPKATHRAPRAPLRASPRIPGVTAPPPATGIYSVTNSPPPEPVHHASTPSATPPPVTSPPVTSPSATSPEPSPTAPPSTPQAPDTTGAQGDTSTPVPGGWGGRLAMAVEPAETPGPAVSTGSTDPAVSTGPADTASPADTADPADTGDPAVTEPPFLYSTDATSPVPPSG